MATLGKALAPYAPHFADCGFHKSPVRDRGPCFADGQGRFISYDRIKGGDLRFMLLVCPSPASPPEIEAESRSWLTEYTSTLESAVEASWQNLMECGFRFLENPLELTPTRWREDHGLLITDHRLRHISITWPSDWSTNDTIIRAKRCIPSFTTASALDLRQRLDGKTSITLKSIPLANALEMQLDIEAHGFTVSIITP